MQDKAKQSRLIMHEEVEGIVSFGEFRKERQSINIKGRTVCFYRRQAPKH